MPQLSLYLDDAAMEKLRLDAAAQGESLSKYVRHTLASKSHGTGSQWPAGFFDLYGSVQDPSFEEPPELDWGTDAPRERL